MTVNTKKSSSRVVNCWRRYKEMRDATLLGTILDRCGKLEEARQQHECALALRKELLPAEDPAIANAANNLSNTLRRLGHYDEAGTLLEQALEIRTKVYGPDHLDVAKVWHDMGNIQLRAGHYTEARDSYERSLAIKRRKLKSDDPSIALTLICRGVLEATVGDYEASRACALCAKREFLRTPNSGRVSSVSETGTRLKGHSLMEISTSPS